MTLAATSNESTPEHIPQNEVTAQTAFRPLHEQPTMTDMQDGSWDASRAGEATDCQRGAQLARPQGSLSFVLFVHVGAVSP